MSYYIIIRGPSSIGKTKIANELATHISAIVLSIDKILDYYSLNTIKENNLISEVSFKKANSFMCKKAREYLDLDIPIIFEGNFYWKSQIEDLKNKLNLKHYIFTLKAPLEKCKDKIEIYNKTNEFDEGIIIDATKTIEEIIKEMKKNIQ